MKSSILAILVAAALAHSGEVEAILDVTNVSGQVTGLSNFIADDLSVQMVGRGDVSLVERGQLKRVLQEQGLQASGSFDEATVSRIGKLLGASKIVTGQYYAMGDEYQVTVKTIDVVTGKLVKAEKLKYPRSESTIKLDQQLITGGSVATPPAVAPGHVVAAQGSTSVGDGPVGEPSCYYYKGLVRKPGGPKKAKRGPQDEALTCKLSINANNDGFLDINNIETKFILDDGTKRDISTYSIANSSDPHEKILAGIPMQLTLRFGNYGYEDLKSFSLFRFVYKFNGKTYEVKGAPSFQIEDKP